MKKPISKQVRIAALSLSSSGFGYAVMEGNNQLVGYGKMVIKKNKNARVLVHTGKIVSRYQPNVLVLQDVNAKEAYRHQRIKKLHRRITARAKKSKIEVVEISGKELRSTLLGNTAGTKQEMAEHIAKQFPDELASRIPTKREAWTSEDSRMDIFDAVGIALTHQRRTK